MTRKEWQSWQDVPFWPELSGSIRVWSKVYIYHCQEKRLYICRGNPASQLRLLHDTQDGIHCCWQEKTFDTHVWIPATSLGARNYTLWSIKRIKHVSCCGGWWVKPSSWTSQVVVLDVRWLPMVQCVYIRVLLHHLPWYQSRTWFTVPLIVTGQERGHCI